MISRHKGPRDAKDSKAKPMATPATIASCSAQTAQSSSQDPWAVADPWGGMHLPVPVKLMPLKA